MILPLPLFDDFFHIQTSLPETKIRISGFCAETSGSLVKGRYIIFGTPIIFG